MFFLQLPAEYVKYECEQTVWSVNIRTVTASRYVTENGITGSPTTILRSNEEEVTLFRFVCRAAEGSENMLKFGEMVNKHSNTDVSERRLERIKAPGRMLDTVLYPYGRMKLRMIEMTPVPHGRKEK